MTSAGLRGLWYIHFSLWRKKKCVSLHRSFQILRTLLNHIIYSEKKKKTMQLTNDV